MIRGGGTFTAMAVSASRLLGIHLSACRPDRPPQPSLPACPPTLPHLLVRVEADARHQRALHDRRGVGDAQRGHVGGREHPALGQQRHRGQQEEGEDGDHREEVDVVQADALATLVCSPGGRARRGMNRQRVRL